MPFQDHKTKNFSGEEAPPPHTPPSSALHPPNLELALTPLLSIAQNHPNWPLRD